MIPCRSCGGSPAVTCWVCGGARAVPAPSACVVESEDVWTCRHGRYVRDCTEPTCADVPTAHARGERP